MPHALWSAWWPNEDDIAGTPELLVSQRRWRMIELRDECLTDD